jgi:penicillin-binding protein 1B
VSIITHNKKSKLALWWKLLIVASVIALMAIIYIDSTIRATFTGKKWSVPATVYARPLELYVGAPLTVQDFKTELGMLGYRFVYRIENPGQARIIDNTVNIYTPGFQFSDDFEPARQVAVHILDGRVSQLVSNDGAQLLRLEPLAIGGIYPSHHEDRLLVKLSEVPESLQNMLVAVEDDRFYSHFGISPRGIVRALIANIKEGGISQGASTLTQQLIKNYYLSSEQTLTRKAREAVMALLLELHFSKSEILEGYINEVYLGQDGPRSIHGFGLASQYYFNRPLSDLSIERQALLVALVRGASYYNPWRNPARALERRNLVLDIAVREERLDIDLAEKAKKRPLGIGGTSAASNRRYPAYLDLVRRQLQRDYKEEDLNSSGLAIFTHFDPLVQMSAESSLAANIAKHASSEKSNELQGAVVITRPNTGAVIAVLGGKDGRYAGFNRALDARRPIGSLLKPAVYLAALEQPERYTLATPISDDEYRLQLPNGDQWAPKNYDLEDHGDVLLYKALAHSYNQATARLGNTIGVDKVVDTVHRLGVKERFPALPSVTLGAVDLLPIEVAQIYQTISADGFYTPLMAINAVVGPGGQLLTSYPLEVDKRFDAASIYMLSHAMQAVTHEGTAKSLEWLLPDFAVAGKTGTTNDLRDSWFAGFSGDMMAVVWLGNDDNTSTGLTGSSGALRVWADIIRQRSRLPIQNLPPENIKMVWVDRETGQGSQRSCTNTVQLPFLVGTEPDQEIRCQQGAAKVIDWFKKLVDKM